MHRRSNGDGVAPRASGGEHAALIWRSDAVRFVLAIVPLWQTTAVLVLWTPWRQKLIVGSVAALTVVSPLYGLLAVAVLTPLGAVIEAFTQLPFRLSEAFVMAFLAAWLLRAKPDRRGPHVPPVMTSAGWLLGVAAAASVGVLAWRLAQSRGELSDIARWLVQAYYVGVDSVGFVEAARVIEGLALVAATLFVFRHRPSTAVSLPAALCLAGAAAAGMSVLMWWGIGPSPLAERYARIGYRVAHVTDVNAAGSYFAMLVCLALGMSLHGRGRPRGGWIALAIMNVVGLWFSESRSALAATGIVVVLAAAWRMIGQWNVRARVAALAILLVLGAAGAFFRARLLERDPTFRGGGFREQFNTTSVRMIAARPLSGIGIGQYYVTSTLFLSPQLAWAYGAENAHDYFLQVGAELGVPGLMLFLIWVGAAFAVVGRAVARSVDARLLGAAAGVLTFLATCITGHPLLVNEVAFPFWLQFALALGLAESAWLNAAPIVEGQPTAARARWAWPVTATAGCLMVLAIVGGGRGPIEPPRSAAVDGFYEWETDENGARFRWTHPYASIFVPADVTRVSIPMRVPTDVRTIAPMGVEVAVGGVVRERALVGSSWATLSVRTPVVALTTRFKRIDLRVDRVWQPALYIAGSGDLRSVGVQVGECELGRER